MTNPNTQAGFTLLEVMIALVIFSIGLLGLSGLQAISLQNNQAAYTRTMATILAYDMADRIRNNLSTQNYASTAAASSDACTATTANCDAAAIAGADLYQWNDAISNSGLLSGTGFITGDSTAYTITIVWDGERKGSTIANTCPTTAAGLECVRIVVVP